MKCKKECCIKVHSFSKSLFSIIFLSVLFELLLIASCVALLYVPNIIEQRKQSMKTFNFPQ